MDIMKRDTLLSFLAVLASVSAGNVIFLLLWILTGSGKLGIAVGVGIGTILLAVMLSKEEA